MAHLHFGMTTPDTRSVFWAFVELGARTKARDSGVELSVMTADDSAEQVSAMRRFAAERVDALLFTPIHPMLIDNPSTIAPNIPLISIEGPDVAGATSYIDTDLSSAAEIATTYLIECLGRQGKLAHIPGPVSSPQRTEGFYRAVARYPGVQVVWEAHGGWTRSGAAEAMRMGLAAHPDIQAVFAHSDEMALGAVAAIGEARQTGTILVAGVDAMPDALIALAAGTMAATVSLEPYQLGALAVDIAVRAIRGEQVARQVIIEVVLVTPQTQHPIALAQLARLPTLLNELAESSRQQFHLQEQIIAAQRSTIEELSSPIMPVNDNTLVLPLVGAIDTRRAARIMESTLDAVVRHQARVIVIDITGVAIIDTQVAHYLLQMAQAVKLLGATVILVGVTPEVAQTVVQLGLDLSSLETRSTLQAALAYTAELNSKR